MKPSQNICLMPCKELRSTAIFRHGPRPYLHPLFFAREPKKGEFFMKNKKTILAVILLVVLAAAALVCWLAFRPQAVEGQKTITVEVTHLDGTVNTFTIHTDAEFLRGAMEQEGILQGREDQYGLYVLTVDGETVDEDAHQWWCFTRSGEQVNYGVESQPIEDGDHYEFSIQVW